MRVDEYGHCVNCGENLILPRVVGGKQIMTFAPNFDQTEFVISNKSRMVVCMCKKCKSSLDLSDPETHNTIMETVKAGWAGELGKDRCPCDAEKLNILFHSENIDDYVVKNRLEEMEK